MCGRWALAVVLVATGIAAVPGRAAATGPPTIVAMSVVGVSRPVPLGSRPVVVVRVRGATLCLFRAQRVPGSSLYLERTTSCASGVARALMPPVLSANTSVARLTYSVLARGPGGTARHSYTIRIAPFVPTPTVQPPTTPTAAGVQQSLNWSGYVLPSSSVVTEVSGSWTVPAVNCSATPDAGVSVWVGIGGTSSESLLQTGIRATCRGGAASYAGWWEEYPSEPNQEADFFPFAVSAGDSITASVYQSSSSAWVTRLDDLTTGMSGWMVSGGSWGVGPDGGTTFTPQGSTPAQRFSGSHTAEWIVEDAVTAGHAIVPFADYGTVSFTNLQTSLGSWSLSPSNGWEIVQDGMVLSTPSLPGSDGTSFSVSYTNNG